MPLAANAAYMLWLYQRTMFGKIENPKNQDLPDLNLRELATFVPLIILAVWIGIYPSPVLRRLEHTVTQVVARVNPAYAAPAAKADCDQPAPAAAAAAEPKAGLAAFIEPPCGDKASPAQETAAGGSNR